MAKAALALQTSPCEWVPPASKAPMVAAAGAAAICEGEEGPRGGGDLGRGPGRTDPALQTHIPSLPRKRPVNGESRRSHWRAGGGKPAHGPSKMVEIPGKATGSRDGPRGSAGRWALSSHSPQGTAQPRWEPYAHCRPHRHSRPAGHEATGVFLSVSDPAG